MELSGDLCENFDQVMEEFTAADPHLVLMDIYLPFYNGYYWCKRDPKGQQCPGRLSVLCGG